MDLWEGLAIFAAGMGAGGINALVGSGTLLTFPVLLALGYPPVTATVSNSIGLAPGSMTSTFGYRAELKGQRRRILRFGTASFIGAVTGATLLLVLPEKVFMVVVPVLILVACTLIVVQPRLNAWLRRRRPARADGGRLLPVGIFGAGTYGGYFAAAQGILLIGLLGTALDDDLQRINALKNTLAAVVNTTAAIYYLVLADPELLVSALIALGAVIGGYTGARFGRRLKPLVLRVLVVVIGLTAVGQLVWEQLS